MKRKQKTKKLSQIRNGFDEHRSALLLTHFLSKATHQNRQEPEDFNFDDLYDQDDGKYAQHDFIFEEFLCVTQNERNGVR